MSNAVTNLANLAVPIGLVLVAFELDQSNDALIGSTQQGLLELLHDSDAWLQDAAFAEIAIEAETRGEPISDVEARQFGEWIADRRIKLPLGHHRYPRF